MEPMFKSQLAPSEYKKLPQLLGVADQQSSFASHGVSASTYSFLILSLHSCLGLKPMGKPREQASKKCPFRQHLFQEHIKSCTLPNDANVLLHIRTYIRLHKYKYIDI